MLFGHLGARELLVIRQNHETGERFADLLKWGLIWFSSKDQPKPIAAKAREPPQRGDANEDRRNEAGGAREGHEGTGDVSVAPGLIWEGAGRGLLLARGHTASFMEEHRLVKAKEVRDLLRANRGPRILLVNVEALSSAPLAKGCLRRWERSASLLRGVSKGFAVCEFCGSSSV